MPFDDENDNNVPKASARKTGLKIDNSKSIFANAVKKPTKQDLDKVVADSQKRNANYNERATELALKFRAFLDDRTVPQNKNVFVNEFEREVIGKLTELAIDMNLDELQEEGMGSVGLIALIFRCLLIQRDKINVLDYTVNQLEKKVKQLQSTPVDTNKPSE